MTAEFETDEQWLKASREASQLLKDAAINTAFLTITKSRLLTALAKQVLARSLAEEQAPKYMYDYLLQVADDKMARDGLAVDLPDMLQFVQTEVQQFVRDELSRLESVERVNTLRRDAATRNAACNVNVVGNWVRLEPGQILLISGRSQPVRDIMERLATVPGEVTYLAEDRETPVPVTDVMYFKHSFLQQDIMVRPATCSVTTWQGRARSVKKWRAMLANIDKKYLSVISNLALAGDGGRKEYGATALANNVTKAVATLSAHIAGGIERIIGGVYVPHDSDGAFEDALAACVSGCKHKNICLVHLEDTL